MAQIQIRFRAIIGDEDLSMFKGGHRAGINVEIGIKFPQSYGKPAGL
jgi:hypothetical protein